MIRNIFFVLPIIFSIEVISSTTSDKLALKVNSDLSDPSASLDNNDKNKKEDRQFVKERQDADAIIKPKISATHQLEASACNNVPTELYNDPTERSFALTTKHQ